MRKRHQMFAVLLLAALLVSTAYISAYAVSQDGVTADHAENLTVNTKKPKYESTKIDVDFTSGGWNVNGVSGAVKESDYLKAEYVDSCYDFESAANAAPFNGDMALATDTDGNKVVSYTTGTGRDYFQNNTAYAKMVDGQEYTLSYRYKVVSLASEASRITLQTAGIEDGGSKDVTVATIDSTTETGVWIRVEHDFTYGGSAYKYWRLLQVSGGTDGDQVYFDDIQVSHMGEPYYEPVADSYYDFEAATSSAPFSGGIMRLATDADDGNKVVSYVPTESSKIGYDFFHSNTAYQDGKMVDGQVYTLSYRYKVVSLASDSSKITFKTAGIEASGSRDVIVATIDSKTEKGVWIQVEHDFTYTGSGYNYWRLLEVAGGVVGDQIYFDDIQISHIKTYDERVYTGGKYRTYQDESEIWTLVSSSAGEFYRDSLVLTPGKTYRFFYEIKTGDCIVTPYLMDRTNSNAKTTLNEYKVAANTDWTTYGFVYFCDGTGKKTNADGNIVYRLGFARSNTTGYVYARNLDLREMTLESDADMPNLQDPSILPAGSALDEESVTVSKNGNVQVTVPNIAEQKKYLLSFRARTDALSNTISAYLGSAGFAGLETGLEDGYLSASIELTPQETGAVVLVLRNSEETVYDNVVLHRIYEYGDINADDRVNVCDLVRYKRCLAEGSTDQPGTYIYADIDRDDAITTADMGLLIQKLLGTFSE